MNQRLLFILMLIVPAVVFGFLNEPNGFRAVTWWSPVPSGWARTPAPQDMAFNIPSPDCWRNPKDELKLGDAKVEEITYLAWKGKICAVYIRFTSSALTDLKKACQAKYGGPENVGYGNVTSLLWRGPRTAISLDYDPKYPSAGALCFQAADLKQKRIDDDRSKVNTKGF